MSVIQTPDSAQHIRSAKTKDLTGKRFGRLECLSFSGYRPIGKKQPIWQAQWLCRCSCGNTKNFMAAQLINGNSKSCGCYAKDVAAELAKKLGAESKQNDGSIAARQLYANYKHGAKKRGLYFEISFEQAMKLYEGDCVYCGAKPTKINHIAASNSFFKYNGIDRVDNDIGYIPENCVSCCKKCNEAKKAMKLEEFADWIKAVYSKMYGDSNARI